MKQIDVGRQSMSASQDEPKAAATRANSERIAHVRSTIKDSLEFFDGSRDSSRSWAFAQQIAIPILGGVTTVLLGIKAGDHTAQWLSGIALVTSALVTLVACWAAFFDSRWVWVVNTRASGDLRILRDELEYATAGGRIPTATELDRIYTDVTKTIRTTNLELSQKRGHTAQKQKV